MPWIVVASGPIADSALDRWVTLPLPPTSGVVQSALRFVPTNPIAPTWTRLGFYYLGIIVENVVLRGPTFSLASPDIAGNPAIGFLSDDWVARALLNSGKPINYFAALSVNRWVGPGEFALLSLT